MNTIVITKFKKEDNVTCSNYGNGYVVRISNNKIFPLQVNFEDQDEDDYVEYTLDGRSLVNGEITLKKS